MPNGLSFDARRSMVQTAIMKTLPKDKSGRDCSYVWIPEIWEDAVVYQYDSKYYELPYSISGEEVKLGEAQEVKEDRRWKPVFSAAAQRIEFKETDPENPEFIIRKGLAFEAGKYPDKGVEFDESDIEAMAEGFVPVPNDIEHISSVFDGHVGDLTSVEAKEGKLFGTWRIPKWFDNLVGDEPIRVSLAFDKEKTIVGSGIVLNPRIEKAAMMSAFSKYKSGESPKTETKTMRTKMKIRDFINLTVSKFTGGSLDNVDLSDPDAEIEVPATTDPEAKVEEPKAEGAEGATAQKSESAEFNNNSLAEMRLAMQAMEESRLNEVALTFANEMINAKKAVPAQSDQIVAAFKSAVKLDNTDKPTCFSLEGKLQEGQNVENIRSLFANSPSLEYLTQESVDVHTFGASAKASSEVTKEETDALLAKTPTGRKILASQNK